MKHTALNPNRRLRRQRQITAIALAGAMLTVGSGCRLCCDLEDQAYSAYGGKWQRTDRDHGRVGSLFEPAGGVTSDLSEREIPRDETRSRLAPSGNWDDEEYPDDLQLPGGPSEAEETSEDEIEIRFEEGESLDTAIVPGPPSPPASY